jgi:phage baseplate assembly protein W
MNGTIRLTRETTMTARAQTLEEIERRRLRALADADVEAAGPLHAPDYQLITPNGSELTRDDYLGDIGAGRLRYTAFEPASPIRVLGEGPVAVLRYQARISFDDSPGMICWHTDCYRRQDARWQVVWSQATRIESGL